METYRRGRFILPALIVLLLMAGRFVPAQQKPKPVPKPDRAETEAVSKWISQSAIPLTSVEAGHGFADLEPLKAVLKNVRIVGLGEATHGTREFFQFKHRMLEFLVKEMGFTVFAIEASYPACFNINNYVLYGKGDRAEALASQKFWTWDTQEVSAMIDWMREYNKTAPAGKQVEFVGYDAQHLDQAIDVVVAYFKKVAPDLAPVAETALAPLKVDPMKITEWATQKEEEKSRILTQLYRLLGLMAFDETRFTRLSSPEEYRFALQHARVLVQSYDAYSRPMGESVAVTGTAFAMRDLYMSENIEFLLNERGPGTKMVVWAHNGHISFASPGTEPVLMGSHLRQVFGDAYYALGFTFLQGSFQSRNLDDKDPQYGALQEFTVGPEAPAAVSWYLSRPGIKDFILDFRSAPKDGKVAQWLNTAHAMRSVGSGFSTKIDPAMYAEPVILPRAFDGIIFIDRTHRAIPNPTGERGPYKKD